MATQQATLRTTRFTTEVPTNYDAINVCTGMTTSQLWSTWMTYSYLVRTARSRSSYNNYENN
eukprot:4338939-Amphidinium_carterae.1